MKNEILVLGDNILSHYFKSKGDYDVYPLSWIYDTDDSYEIIETYKAIIYVEEKRKGHLSELMSVNSSIPNNIINYLKAKGSPVSFVYISTAELYNGNYEWEKTNEFSNELNVSNDYLLTKRIGERVLEEKNALILRIKNPFSEYYHSDNWLVKALKSEEPLNWMDCHSYLPDLENAIKVLLREKKTGIYNCVQTETGSDLYYLQILGIEKYKNYDINNDGVTSEDKIGADVNSSRLKNFIDFQPMNFAVVYSMEKLKDKLDNNTSSGKVEVCE